MARFFITFGNARPEGNRTGGSPPFGDARWSTITHVAHLYDANNNGEISLISKSTEGVQKDQGTESVSRIVQPSISPDGRYTAFMASEKLDPKFKSSGAFVFDRLAK